LYVTEISYGLLSSLNPDLAEKYSKNATLSRSNDATSELTTLPPLTANNKPPNENKSTLVVKENEYYSLDFKFTGLAVMINNYNFTNEANNFPDQISDKDIENFETLKKFNFKTNYYLNQSKKLIDHLIAFYTMFDYTDYACLFFCMSSHGAQHTIMSSDCIYMDIYEGIIEPFYQVESLKNKPKIFLFDCCRGRETMYKADVGAFIDINQNKPMRKEKEWKFADFSNFFFAYSTVINFISGMSIRKGSYFMSAFFEVLNNHGNAEDWDELKRKVVKLMNERHKQAPEFVSRSQFKFAFVKLEKKVDSLQSIEKRLQEQNEQLQQQLQLQQKQQLEQQQKFQQEIQLLLQQVLQTKQQILQPTQTIVYNNYLINFKIIN
jgi:hypothetical protein